jgi:hypothetical protein
MPILIVLGALVLFAMSRNTETQQAPPPPPPKPPVDNTLPDIIAGGKTAISVAGSLGLLGGGVGFFGGGGAATSTVVTEVTDVGSTVAQASSDVAEMTVAECEALAFNIAVAVFLIAYILTDVLLSLHAANKTFQQKVGLLANGGRISLESNYLEVKYITDILSKLGVDHSIRNERMYEWDYNWPGESYKTQAYRQVVTIHGYPWSVDELNPPPGNAQAQTREAYSLLTGCLTIARIIRYGYTHYALEAARLVHSFVAYAQHTQTTGLGLAANDVQTALIPLEFDCDVKTDGYGNPMSVRTWRGNQPTNAKDIAFEAKPAVKLIEGVFMRQALIDLVKLTKQDPDFDLFRAQGSPVKEYTDRFLAWIAGGYSVAPVIINGVVFSPGVLKTSPMVNRTGPTTFDILGSYYGLPGNVHVDIEKVRNNDPTGGIST